ncbi:MAG: Minf_1886 family protein [Algisphaera sp.]
MLSGDLANAVNATQYPVDAFIFVQRGLDYTVRQTHGELEATDPLFEDDDNDDRPSRHVSGDQLCEGLRDFARREYGLLANTVLGRWHVTHTEDFGHIVFAMVDAGMMHKTDQDTIEDFRDVFAFNDAFGEGSLTLP